MEVEPTSLAAEPVHTLKDVRDFMRQKVFTNLVAVGGLADLGELAHKVQPDLVPDLDTTVTEDTVTALLRAVIALTLVPPPLEAASPPEIPSPPTLSSGVSSAVLPAAAGTAAAIQSPSRSRMKRTLTYAEGADPVTADGRAVNEAIHFMETNERVSAAQAAACAYRTAAIDDRHGQLSAEVNAEGMAVESTAQALRARDKRTSSAMGVGDDATELARPRSHWMLKLMVSQPHWRMRPTSTHRPCAHPAWMTTCARRRRRSMWSYIEHMAAARGVTASQQ